MIYEDLRLIHEDIERLEAAIADRLQDQPKHPREQLRRDHEISLFLTRIQQQSSRALDIYNEQQQSLLQEIQSISTGDPIEAFYARYEDIKDFHKRYPNEPMENLERAYRKTEDGVQIEQMFSGEEAYGRFFDLISYHETYLNLPGIKDARKLTYLQYLDTFDQFSVKKDDKMNDSYFSYVTSLAQYLEGFMRRTKPLEDLDGLFKQWDDEFERLWSAGDAPGWKAGTEAHVNGSSAPVTEGTGEGVWCADCEKEFSNLNTYKAHLSGKKHVRNAEARRQTSSDTEMANGNSTAASTNTARLKEKALAEREHRTRKLTSAMKTEREDTRVNVERKAGMTDRERQQELDALYAEDEAAVANGRQTEDGDEDSDGEEKIYNPLKLPLAWDGKPIPFWLYKLHGLGVEFPCEICGNYVYMGRRAFDKHFSEARHIYGLKCLGITSTSLFREITGIEEAQRLWEKIKRDREKVQDKSDGVVQMEDSAGNVMPQRVWEDLNKAGLL